jgi:hypothetical protein
MIDGGVDGQANLTTVPSRQADQRSCPLPAMGFATYAAVGSGNRAISAPRASLMTPVTHGQSRGSSYNLANGLSRRRWWPGVHLHESGVPVPSSRTGTVWGSPQPTCSIVTFSSSSSSLQSRIRNLCLPACLGTRWSREPRL